MVIDISYKVRFIAMYCFYEYELLNFLFMSLTFYFLADLNHKRKKNHLNQVMIPDLLTINDSTFTSIQGSSGSHLINKYNEILETEELDE